MNKSISQRVGLADAPGKPPSVPECLEMVYRQSNDLINAVLDGLARSIDPVQKITKQVQFGPLAKAAVEELLDHRAQVQEVFALHLRKGMYLGTGVSPENRPLVRFDQLQLLADDQLDESIEVARAEHELASSVDEHLPPVDALMSTVLGWITVQAHTNPVRPEVFVRALRESFLPHVKDAEVRGSLIAPAGNILGVSLRRLYKELANWLRSRGVEPAGLKMTGGLASKPDSTAGLGSSVVRTLLTLDRLRRLLTGELDGENQDAMSKALGKNKDFLHTVPASIVALQDMQQVEVLVSRLSERARDPGQQTGQDAERRARMRAMSDNRQLGEAIGHEVVRLMVDNLVQDERLLPKVRQLLQSLEPVLLGQAKGDAQFFQDRQHPARLFVDKLIQRSLAYTTENDEEFFRFLRSAEDAVARLLEAPDDQALPFVAMIERLESVWANEDQSLRVRREEAARALLHAEQRYLLAQKLAQEFEEQVRDKDVPTSVVNFLCGPWAQSVAEAQLSSADGSDDPHGYVSLVGDLIWSVQPAVAKRNRRRLVQIIPGMLTKLREGLSLVEFPPELIADLFDQLIATHKAALDGARPSDPTSSASNRPQPSVTDSDWNVFGPTSLPPAPPDVWLGPNEAAGAGYLKDDSVSPMDIFDDEEPPSVAAPVAVTAAVPAQASALVVPVETAPPTPLRLEAARPVEAVASTAVPKVALPKVTPPKASQQPSAPQMVAPKSLHTGSWIELSLEGEWTRLQLTWASPHRTLFMFTSRGGKAHSMSQRTMEKLREQGLMRVISDGRVVEQALDAIAEMALRNSAEQARSEPGEPPSA